MNNYFAYALIALGLSIGFLAGMTLGTQLALEKVIYVGAGIFADSNININLEFNETELTNEFNKTIIPELKNIQFKEAKK